MKTYTHQEATEASIKYFDGDELAANVFVSKYALRDLEGNLYEAVPTDMHRRLAREFARIESKYPNPMSEKEIFSLLANVGDRSLEDVEAMSWEDLESAAHGFGPIVAQGSPMSAIGNPFQFQSLSNCFVIESPHDSYGGIMKTDQEQVQIMKRRGGVGFDISSIRPKGIKTANAARTTDGIGIFMERFSNTCREVAQGGRRGALMLCVSCVYPQILDFIDIKRDLTKVTGANLSIRFTDDFMRAVKSDSEVTLKYPVDSNAPIVSHQEKATKIWDAFTDAAWKTGEPAPLFWDTIIRRCPADIYVAQGFGSIGVNPCSELTLSAFDSCRLLLVNLVKFVVDPFTPFAKFDYVKFDLIAQKAQRLMDDLVDLEIEAIDKILEKIKADPEPADVKVVETNLWEKIRSATVNGRRTGLGVTAVGDALAYQGVRYGSDASIKMTGDMYKALCLASYRSSVTMAKERGPFPVYSHELEVGHPFIEQVMNEDPELRSVYDKFGRRNIANTTTPPAGSVSIETQTSSGPEPVFMLSYKRRKKINPNDESASVDFIDKMGDKWQEFTVYHHGLKKWAEVTGKSIDCHDESPYHGATAHEIDWLKKVDLQAAAQKWVCHSISSTVNLPKEATVQDVKNVYMHAWESGCKGITVYRDGSRDGVMVSNSSKPSTDKNGTVKVVERPKELPCDIHRVNVKGESYLVLVGLLNGEPYEVFAGRSEYVEVPKKAKSGVLIKNGKKDGLSTYNLKIPVGDDDFVVFKDVVELFQNPTYGAFTRTISLAIRHGAPVNNLVEQLRKDKNSDITSFSSVIARVLAKGYIPDGTKLTNGAACPNCGSNNVAYLGGCATCMACGHSKCQ